MHFARFSYLSFYLINYLNATEKNSSRPGPDLPMTKVEISLARPPFDLQQQPIEYYNLPFAKHATTHFELWRIDSYMDRGHNSRELK